MLLREYSDSLRIHFFMILRFETLLNYIESLFFILFKNLAFAENDSKVINEQLDFDLKREQII
jgi:hypothetical protein